LTLPTQASVLNTPVASNAYITLNGLEWAWGNAVEGADLSIQAAFGWRLPTVAELASAPLATQFLFAGANAGPGLNNAGPDGSFFTFDPLASFPADGYGACAAAWFGTLNTPRCEWGNGLGQQPGNSGWAGSPGAQSHYEQLVVREVPEPETFALLGLGLAGLGFSRRRKQI
jgi:hypothetical protein